MKKLFRKGRVQKGQLPGKMPKEVEEYYKASHKGQKAISFLLMIATLLVTLVLSFAIFYGGKGLYRALKKDTKQTATDQAPKNNQPDSGKPSQPDNSKAPNPSTSPVSTPNTPTTPTTGPGTIPNTGPTSDLN